MVCDEDLEIGVVAVVVEGAVGFVEDFSPSESSFVFAALVAIFWLCAEVEDERDFFVAIRSYALCLATEACIGCFLLGGEPAESLMGVAVEGL